MSFLVRGLAERIQILAERGESVEFAERVLRRAASKSVPMSTAKRAREERRATAEAWGLPVTMQLAREDRIRQWIGDEFVEDDE